METEAPRAGRHPRARAGLKKSLVRRECVVKGHAGQDGEGPAGRHANEQPQRHLDRDFFKVVLAGADDAEPFSPGRAGASRPRRGVVSLPARKAPVVERFAFWRPATGPS
jgi:hypothetical protein